MSIPSESFLILVVEDDRLSRQILCRSLIQEGYQVVEACNGEECLSVYEQTQPNLVLLYVTKPIHWPILRRRVRNVLEKGYLYRELKLANHKLQEHAITDGLTGLANRRHFDDCLDREWKRSSRDQGNLSLILCDVDYFKSYNDTYGHQAGDVCLQRIAQTLRNKAAKRATDIVARYGGEEFAAILPSTALDGALEVAGRLQASIETLAIDHSVASSSHKQITISQGIASMIANRDTQLSTFINWADQALYHAKKSGRNAIAVYHDGQLMTSKQHRLAL